MRCFTLLRVEDRRHATHLAEHWPTHLLAVVDHADAAVLPRWQRVVRHVEVCSDLTDASQQRAPTVEQASRIVGFARHLGTTDRLLVHCAGGISRSSAAAMMVWATQGRDPSAALRNVIRLRGRADPNPLMLQHADLLLHGGEPRLLAVWWGWVSSAYRQVPDVRSALAEVSGWTPQDWTARIRSTPGRNR